MPTYSYGSWIPDLTTTAVIDATGALRLREALNVIPGPGCYEPQADVVVATNSLSATCMGAFACTDKNGIVNWFAGTSAELSRMHSNTLTWSVVSAGGGYALTSEDRWSFAKYGNRVFAAAVTNNLQHMTMSSGSSFSDVAGSPPRFRHIAVVKNFLLGAGTADDPQRVQWSGLDNPNTWTVDAATFADYQDLLGPGGWNTGIVVGLAGSDAVIMQERSVWRMLYVGEPYIFQIDPVENARGAIAPGSIVQAASYAYYLSDDGFYKFDGSTSVPIGMGRVDNTFLADVDMSRLDAISSIADAHRSIVLWHYKSVDGSSPNKILVYNWQMDNWSLLEQEGEYLWRSLNRSSGATELAVFDTSHRAATFTGTNKAATITTAEYQLSGGRSLVREVYPLIEGASPTVQLGYRPHVLVSNTVTAVISLNAYGYAPCRVDSRYFQSTQRVAAGSSWSHWKGMKINATPTGIR